MLFIKIGIEISIKAKENQTLFKFNKVIKIIYNESKTKLKIFVSIVIFNYIHLFIFSCSYSVNNNNQNYTSNH